MNFEQLLDGATKGPWVRDGICVESKDGNVGIVNLARHSKTDAEYIARVCPAVMREVWAALREVAEPSNWFFDEGAYQMVCRKDVRTRCTRALALLDGQTEDKP